MRTITTTKNIYTFEELTPEAKENAAMKLNEEYFWASEAIESLKEFAKYFGSSLKNYSIDWSGSSYSSARFSERDMEPEEIESRLMNAGSFNPDTFKGNGDCKLTGVCTDESCLDGFRIAWMKGERDLGELLKAGFETWLDDCQKDYTDQCSIERTAEHCEANGYEFDEDGNLI